MSKSVTKKIQTDPKHAQVYDSIMQNDAFTEVEKLKKMFDYVTTRFIEHSRREVELLRAMGDGETVIKEHIKLGVMDAARGMFEFCYRRVTDDRRRSVWDE